MANNIENHIKNLVTSYQNLLGRSLIANKQINQTLEVFFDQAPFVLLSHGVEPDPILNYGNQQALKLWEMTKQEFLKTPSKETAETPLQEEREKLLQKVTKYGFIDNYNGIRISKSKKRFIIKNAVVWNVFNPDGLKIGQAATFSEWEYL